MTGWQKRARLVVAVVGVAVLALVIAGLRGKKQPRKTESVARADPKAVAESAGGVLTQASGTSVPGIVEYERSMTYADGSTRLLGARITTDRQGRRFLVSGKELKAAKDQANVQMAGDVNLLSSDGLHAHSEQATYERTDGVIRAPGPVRFSKGAVSGTAIGMTYDQKRDVLWLLEQAHVIVKADAKTKGTADITAGSFGYARRDKYMRFERGCRALREGRIIEADTCTAFLTDDESKLKTLELRSNSRITTSGATEGGLQQMAARDMNISYGPDGETIEHAVLLGTGAIQLAGANGGAGRKIAGSMIDVQFAPDGSLTAISAREQVELVMPATKDTPERVIKSRTMTGTGEAGKGLTAAKFLESVEFRETRAPGQQRIARSRSLDVAMAPGTGAIEKAKFGGTTRFEDGALRAAAADGDYQVDKGVLALTGKDGPNDPQVQTDRLTVTATRIDLTFEGTKLLAGGDVRSVLKPAPKDADPNAPKEHVPGMLKDDQPVYVTADKMDYDGDRSFATYTGNARLWQADTTILGATIILDDKSGDLKASGQVRSAFTVEQVDQKTNQPTKVPSIATAEDMHYEDAFRRATYTTNAHMNGPQGDCRAVKIEIYFTEEGNSLERVEAYDNVKLIADARTATGARMTYFAADERYHMTGAPVTIVEECRETTGKTLTFFRSIDRIIVDGNEEIRTFTKQGASGTAAATAPAGSAPATCTPTAHPQ